MYTYTLIHVHIYILIHIYTPSNTNTHICIIRAHTRALANTYAPIHTHIHTRTPARQSERASTPQHTHSSEHAPSRASATDGWVHHTHDTWPFYPSHDSAAVLQRSVFFFDVGGFESKKIRHWCFDVCVCVSQILSVWDVHVVWCVCVCMCVCVCACVFEKEDGRRECRKVDSRAILRTRGHVKIYMCVCIYIYILWGPERNPAAGLSICCRMCRLSDTCVAPAAIVACAQKG